VNGPAEGLVNGSRKRKLFTAWTNKTRHRSLIRELEIQEFDLGKIIFTEFNEIRHKPSPKAISYYE
jgi:hypothetical protein